MHICIYIYVGTHFFNLFNFYRQFCYHKSISNNIKHVKTMVKPILAPNLPAFSTLVNQQGGRFFSSCSTMKTGFTVVKEW